MAGVAGNHRRRGVARARVAEPPQDSRPLVVEDRQECRGRPHEFPLGLHHLAEIPVCLRRLVTETARPFPTKHDPAHPRFEVPSQDPLAGYGAAHHATRAVGG